MNREKEQKQLIRLRAEAARPKPLHYIGIAMILLTIVYIVDEITSNMNSAMQLPYSATRISAVSATTG